MSRKNSNILTINGGSSSLKFAMYEMAENPKLKFLGNINRIGLDNPAFTVTSHNNNEKKGFQIDASDFQKSVAFLIEWLEKQPGFDQVKCIGHRIVHGMNHTQAEIIDEYLLQELKRISEYSPDHLPVEIEIIRVFKKQCPGLLQVACFDTAFHATLPRIAKMLPIPRRFDQAGIQRYGFHGLSYAYLMEELEKIREENNLRRPKKK